MDNMLFRFTLGDASWTLDMHEIRADDAIELRKITGVKWPLLVVGFNTDEPVAVKAFLWLARKMSGDPVAWDDEAMNYKIMDLRIQKVTPDGEPEAPADEPGAGAAEEVEPPDPTNRPSAKQPPRKRKTSGTRSRG